MAKPRRRIFKEAMLQALYDDLRSRRPDPERLRQMSGSGNGYAVGYTRPDRKGLFQPGTPAYVAWAAGVDNAKDDARSMPGPGTTAPEEPGHG